MYILPLDIYDTDFGTLNNNDLMLLEKAMKEENDYFIKNPSLKIHFGEK